MQLVGYHGLRQLHGWVRHDPECICHTFIWIATVRFDYATTAITKTMTTGAIGQAVGRLKRPSSRQFERF